MIEFSRKRFLPRLYMHPVDALPKSTFNGKINVSVRKITAAFGSASGVAMDIAQYVDRNRRSAWLILSPQEYSWFVIDRVHWRKQVKPQVIKVPDDSQDQKMVTEAATWIKNNDYNLTYSDREIILSESAWWKDNLMASAQRLICKSVGNLASWQSFLSWRRRWAPFHKLGEERIQSMHDGNNNWVLSFNSNGRVANNETLVARRCLKALYKSPLDKDETFQLHWHQSRIRKMPQDADYLQLRLRQIFWKGFNLPSLNSM